MHDRLYVDGLAALDVALAGYAPASAQGAHAFPELTEKVREADAGLPPETARSALQMLGHQLHALALQIKALERQLLAWHKRDAASQRLATIPGVGIISATALAATVTDPSLFRSGRKFFAFLGLVPRQKSSGGKDWLGRITKMGDDYLRKLLVVGTTSVIRRAKTGDLAAAPWIRLLLERKPARVVPSPWPIRPPASSGPGSREARPPSQPPPADRDRSGFQAAAPNCEVHKD